MLLSLKSLVLPLLIHPISALFIPTKTDGTTKYLAKEAVTTLIATTTVTTTKYHSSTTVPSQSQLTFLPLTTTYTDTDSQALHWASFAALEYFIYQLSLSSTEMTEVNEFMEYQSNVSFTPGVVAYQKDYVSSILDDMTELVSGKFDDWPDTISDYVYSYYTRLVSSTNDDTTTALLNQSMLIPDDFSVYSNLALCTELIGELSNPLVLTESGYLDLLQ
ncbi:unnamed protein product [Ambrosiozyma monospora]|uniref:Unnamed protein product n=1 Tax=Ambrosiozyma monospora TaxID=43982 RepID=A0ACB5SS14_AMBMO|nr:unnamed protein product [Ambrosiozyma monospora]